MTATPSSRAFQELATHVARHPKEPTRSLLACPAHRSTRSACVAHRLDGDDAPRHQRGPRRGRQDIRPGPGNRNCHAAEAVQKYTQAAHSTTEQAKAATSATHKVTSQVKAAKHTAPVKASTPAPVRDLADLRHLSPGHEEGPEWRRPGRRAPTRPAAGRDRLYHRRTGGGQAETRGQTIGIVDAVLRSQHYRETPTRVLLLLRICPSSTLPGGPTLTVVKDSALGTVGPRCMGRPPATRPASTSNGPTRWPRRPTS